MMSPTVSVVMPVYHTEEYLEEAVRSILDQPYPDIELVALYEIDQPEVKRILDSFGDPRLRIIQLGAHIGVPGIMNLSRLLVRGKYICRMDSDDISLPCRIEKEVAFLDGHPDVGAVGGQIEYINPDGTHRQWMTLPTSYAGILWAMPKYNPIANPTTMMRADIFKRVGADPTMRTGAEDYEYWVRIADVAKICNLPDCVLKYRVKDISGLTDNPFYRRDAQRKADEESIRQKAKGIFWRNLKRVIFGGESYV